MDLMVRLGMTFLRIFFISILFSTTVFAQSNKALNFGIRHGFEGTRAMGMGNAFTAVADDNTAIFYNPAGLSQLEKGESNWFIKLDADPEIKDFYDEIDTASKQTDSASALTNAIQKRYGDTFSLRLPSLGVLWARPNWGISFIPLDLSIDMGLNRAVGPGVNLTAIQDSTLAFSYNWKIKKWQNAGSFNVGVTTKLIYRVNVDEIVDIATIDQSDGEIFDKNDAKEGMTLDADVGFLWKGPWQSFNPSASLVVRNIGDYGYFSNLKLVGDQTGAPQKLHRVIDLGYAMDLPSWWIWSSKVSFDIRDMLHPNWNYIKGTHLGVEFMWQVASWFRGGWRAGLNQGYWTAGFTGEFGFFKLDLASYGEEIGVQGTRNENRRVMMTMSLDF
jgi:hypothetical protein